MGSYENLMEMKKGSLLEVRNGNSAFCVVPDMGGRIFALIDGISVHRIDIENILSSDRPFNNFGGGNFWPAPEGGRFGFNYRGDEWYVQRCINDQPFEVILYNGLSVIIEKRIELLNRSGTVLEVLMKRNISSGEQPVLFDNYTLKDSLTYISEDSFNVLNNVDIDRGLISAWTLEQFDADENRISFCMVNEPETAINFDFYEHPNKRITYCKKGFIYRTDGLKKGQIGVKRKADPHAIGFLDFERGVVCIRQNLTSAKDGLYFNIADNEQINGPFSTEDTYSIFNSGDEARFFELETIGCADVKQKKLLGSRLVSLTSFAVFEDRKEINIWMREKLGINK
jgi:hypothetical protein